MSNGVRWSQQMLDDYRSRTKASSKPVPAAPKRGKYGAHKVEQGGIKFDSKKEAARWLVLEQLEQAGKISDLKRQVAFVLAPAVKIQGRTKPALRYFADAVYIENGQLTVEDTKSPVTRKTAIYRAKLHLMATVHGLQIREI